MTGRSPGSPNLKLVLGPLLNWLRSHQVPPWNIAGRAANPAWLAVAAGAAAAAELSVPADGAATADADSVAASASPAPTASARRGILVDRRPLNLDEIAILPLQERNVIRGDRSRARTG